MPYLYLWTVPVQDVERLANGRLAKVPVLTVVKLTQLRLQGTNVDVLIIVEVTEPAGGEIV